jgi:hypothetical protein
MKCYVHLIPVGGRKHSENEDFASKSSMALSRYRINKQTANDIADVRQCPSVVLPDGSTHISRPVSHTIPSDLEEISSIYSPLIGDAIRLLHIHPSVDKTLGLEADLVHFPLLSAQSKNYKALSYIWGKEKASVSITVNGGSMLIRPNLDKILRTLRDLKHEYVWVGTETSMGQHLEG